MKAARYSEYGGPDVIQIQEVQSPSLKENQILAQVKAAAINPFDGKLRSGMFKDSIPLELPATIGGDFSGVVSQVADGVTGFKAGDEVYGSANILGGGSGALAEILATDAGKVAVKPANVSHAQAAALVVVGVSAIQALEQLHLGPGKKVLIHGGAGGIGSASIQYSKHLGAYVATTIRAADNEFVSGLGADETIDYEQQKFEELLHDYDAVFDTVGGENYKRSFQVLKPGGIIISMNEKPDQELADQHRVSALYQSTSVESGSLERLRELIESGVIEPQVDREFPLEQAAEAFKHLETGHPRGKVVISLRSS